MPTGGHGFKLPSSVRNSASRLDSWKPFRQLSAGCNSSLHFISLIFSVSFLIKHIALNTQLGSKPSTYALCMCNMTAAVGKALEYHITTAMDSCLVHSQSHLLVTDDVLFPLVLLQQVNDPTLLTQDSLAEQL